MRRFAILAALILGISMLAACGKAPQNPSDNASQPTGSAPAESDSRMESDESSASDESTESVKPTDPAELASLRENITESGDMLGVGFVGYIDSESDEAAARDFAANSALAESYPFLMDCAPVLTEGAELYALVPANTTAAVTIYPAEMSEDGSYIDHKDAPLYTGDEGEAIVVRCNLSEIYSNVLISVKDGANTLEFHPMLSMKDGRVATEPGCYDFTDYEMTEEELAQNASDLLTATDEVRDALGRGMKLLYTGDTQVVNGQQCLLFALGTEHEEQFVREELYAVSDDLIYVYSALSDSWEILGAG